MKQLKFAWVFVVVLALAACGQDRPNPELKVLDNVQNDVEASGVPSAKIVTVQRGGSATVKYSIGATNGDGQNGCNAADGTSATVTPSIPGTATGVTKNPSSVTFDNCTDEKSVSFAASATAALGDHEITVSVSDSGSTATVGTYNTNPAKFTLRVVAATPSDTSPPVITIATPANGAGYKLHQVVNADYTCTDDESEVTKCEGDVDTGSAIDTGTVGAKAFTVSAASAGGTSSLTHNYTVAYDFGGFLAPLNALPTRNVVKAGRAIPVKFSLGGDQGLGIFNGNAPKSSNISCTPAGTDPVEETSSAGSSSLSYDASTGIYTYVWKSDSTWAGKCRSFYLNLNDGSSHEISFQFTK